MPDCQRSKLNHVANRIRQEISCDQPKVDSEGLEPSPVRLRAGCAAVNTLSPVLFKLFKDAVARWHIQRVPATLIVRTVWRREVRDTSTAANTDFDLPFVRSR